MKHDEHHVFIVHSKSRPWQNRLYDCLEGRLAKLAIRVTHYTDWPWDTPGGISDRQWERQVYDYHQGYRDIQGTGIHNPPPELAHVLGRHRPRDINLSDLASLIAESSVIVKTEDSGQEAISAGVSVELNLLRGSGKRTLNVRICDDLATAYRASVYPLDDPLLTGGALAVRRTLSGCFNEHDLDVMVLVIALWCDDIPELPGLASLPGLPKHDPNFAICPVTLSLRGMFRHNTTLRLAASDDDHVRRCTLMYVSTCHGGLRHELCRFLGRMMMKMSWRHRHIADYQRFIELTPDIDWTGVVQAIDANDANRQK